MIQLTSLVVPSSDDGATSALSLTRAPSGIALVQQQQQLPERDGVWRSNMQAGVNFGTVIADFGK
jgi:hypothetical protein